MSSLRARKRTSDLVTRHGAVNNLWRLDLDRILHAIGLDKPDALDDVHVAVVRDSNGLAEWQEDLRKDGHGIDDQGIALPAADRMAAERQVWIVRVCPPVDLDAANALAVVFAENCQPARREQELAGAARHDDKAWHSFRQAVDVDVVGLAGLDQVDLLREIGGCCRRPRRRHGAELEVRVLAVGHPDATPVR